MARIAVAGIQHETNTFADSRADLAAFLEADAWPGLVRGADLPAAVEGVNLPAAGFIAAARALRHQLVPLLWCSAQPSGPVTREAYETICAELLERLTGAGQLDGVYLDLHGAMVAEHIADADGELLRRVRAVVGPTLPIVASLDFHANAGGLQARQASALIAYQTYPHVDMSLAGERAAHCIDGLLRERRGRPLALVAQPPFLIALTAQSTLASPMREIMRDATLLGARSDIVALNFTPGFPLADVPHAGPAITGFGFDAPQLAAAVRELTALVESQEAAFAPDLLSVGEGIALATASVARGEVPVVLADTQDNPGAGGDADATSLLKAAMAAGLPRIVAGIYCDPDTAVRAHVLGLGASFEGEVGSRTGIVGESPLRGRFTVRALGDGNFTATGPFYLGSRMALGPMVQLEHNNARIVVASRKQQAADQAMFRHVGIEPAAHSVLILKSSVHFRADFGSLARRIIIVCAPGRSPADPSQLLFRNLRQGLRLAPTRSA
ncbi:MAG TPA: M81 family metallopeptidase [Steroidobacteraceae bacterium]|nr:M81 family metallopeptidase [Steroidobacteraceae bacterium]